jgi:hypothetical protein
MFVNAYWIFYRSLFPSLYWWSWATCMMRSFIYHRIIIYTKKIQDVHAAISNCECVFLFSRGQCDNWGISENMFQLWFQSNALFGIISVIQYSIRHVLIMLRSGFLLKFKCKCLNTNTKYFLNYTSIQNTSYPFLHQHALQIVHVYWTDTPPWLHFISTT